MKPTRCILALVAAITVAGWTPALSLAGEEIARSNDEARLIEILQSDAELFEKAKACQRLGVIGGEKAIPVLASLLSDSRLAHYARFGLEPNPSPAVDEALRQAMRQLDGELLIGVINSIGRRGDPKALRVLIRRMEQGSDDLAAAAATAIGRIQKPRAAQALRKALAEATGQRRAAVAMGCLVCAETMHAAGKKKPAISLYDTLRQTELPRHLQLAGLRGAILARGAGGGAVLAEALRSEDDAEFATALLVAREMNGSRATTTLLEELDTLPPARRALALLALGDRGDRAALPVALAAARSGPAAVRVAALQALRGLADASAVEVLLTTSVDDNAEVAEAARSTLAALGGGAVDAAIVTALEGAGGKLRAAVIELVGRRRIESAVPSLRKASTSDDAQVRLAAIQALGRTVGLEDLSLLTTRLVEPGSPEEALVAREALRTACRRMPDAEACAEELESSLAGAAPEAQARLLGVFSAIGGDRALEIVTASAGSENAGVREAATQALGEWRSEDAADALLELIRNYDRDQDRLHALRGFRDLVVRLGFPKERRIGVCVEAMKLVSADDQRKLVIEALAGIPAPETLDVLTGYLDDPALREAASAAAIKISERIVRSRRGAVARAMGAVADALKEGDLASRARELERQATAKP